MLTLNISMISSLYLVVLDSDASWGSRLLTMNGVCNVDPLWWNRYSVVFTIHEKLLLVHKMGKYML